MTAGPDEGPPVLTVVLPTRGRRELVRDAVRSVVAQDYDGVIECVVVHDQEDEDRSLVALGRPGREVRVMRNIGTPGLAGSRNSGVRASSSEFLASCDDDDVWAPEKVRLQLLRLQDDDGMGVVGAGITLLLPGRRRVDWLGSHDLVTRTQLLRSRHKELHSSTLLMRRTFWEAVGPYEETLPQGYAEDYEWLLRASELSPVGVVRRPLAVIRKDGPSWFRDRSEVIAEALERLLEIHPALTASRPGHARILGQIAFARASLGERRRAAVWVLRALLRWPVAPQAWMAVSQLVLGVDPRRFLGVARRAGRGIA